MGSNPIKTHNGMTGMEEITFERPDGTSISGVTGRR